MKVSPQKTSNGKVRPIVTARVPVSRVEWIDIGRGLMIFIMLTTHSWKSIPELHDWGMTHLPYYFQRFTNGFVAWTGLILVVLSHRIFATRNHWRYCLSRGGRLILLSVLLHLFMVQSPKKMANLVSFTGNPDYWWIDYLAIGNSWGFYQFLVRIGMFLLVAPLLLPGKDRFPWRALTFIPVVIGIVHWIDWNLALDTKESFYLYKRFTHTSRTLIAGSLGVVFGWLYQKYKGNLIGRPWIGLSLFIGGILLTEVNRYLYLSGQHGRNEVWFTVNWSICIISLLGFAHFLEYSTLSTAKRLFKLLGKYAFMIFVIHLPILGWVAPLYAQVGEGPYGGLIYFAITFSTISLGCCIVIWIRRRLPLLDVALRQEVGI